MANDEELDRKNRAVVQQSWAELNPYNNIEPTHPKSLIDILDDFFVNCVDKYPDLFLVKCGALGKLTRCRKGVYERETDVLPPPLDIAKANNIVNRWNPPGKRYLYAAHSWRNPDVSNLTENEYTCFQEMRAKKGVSYTFADFEINVGSANKYVINMDYTGLGQSDIEAYYDRALHNQAQTIAHALIRAGVFPSKEQLMPIIQKGTQELAVGYIGRSFLLPICQTIFTAIDDDKCPDGEEREKAYKSFHVLADYLEKKSIAGVIYPSTRTALQDMHTQNIVGFNVEDFSVVSGSLRTLIY